ncbi:MAG: hypothetical protein U1F66_06450 [bacterium]
MKNLHRWLLLSFLLLLPLSLEAKTDDDPGPEKVCFCHNTNHNPHTICTANQALINAHMDHVNGEVPGVQDSLGECESEPNPTDNPNDGNDGEGDGEIDDGDPPAETPPPDDGDDVDDEQPGEATPAPSEEGNDPGSSHPTPKDQGSVGGEVAGGEGFQDNGNSGSAGTASAAMEGSGCSLNVAASGAPGSALAWALLAAVPLWRTRRR